jgi:hypothetical protein
MEPPSAQPLAARVRETARRIGATAFLGSMSSIAGPDQSHERDHDHRDSRRQRHNGRRAQRSHPLPPDPPRTTGLAAAEAGIDAPLAVERRELAEAGGAQEATGAACKHRGAGRREQGFSHPDCRGASSREGLDCRAARWAADAFPSVGLGTIAGPSRLGKAISIALSCASRRPAEPRRRRPSPL